ncbi:hypothetical protein SBOR_0892 [Sclerotinia borealis F-4128]|uniref:Uncharacterized protein n=1 Tax=Sclerotinia borealis (strain F-4128) TaxID=1432307 RepID=W9CVL8_SCLBF|nr:hypothetical protein SBOR_0892 [Sclerotinia borealis F-4128]
MLSKIILPFLIGAASFVHASPVPDTLSEKRTCGTQLFPSQLVQLSQANPNTAYPNTWNTDKSVKISQDVDGNGNPTNQYWQLIAFPALPAGSYGCSLALTFPHSYSPTISGISPALNVYTVSTPLPNTPTFNNISPKINSGIFGTVTPASDQNVVISSEACNGGSGLGLAFVFRYADWVKGQGSVEWTEYVNALNGEGELSKDA